jgi:hypothetical protein
MQYNVRDWSMGRTGWMWFRQIKGKCPDVKRPEFYALPEPHNFLEIYEEPVEKAAAKASMKSLFDGTFEAQSSSAVPKKELLKLTEEI